jgi:hypothetical protein
MSDSVEQKGLPAVRVKKIFRESLGHEAMHMSGSASELLADVTTEFVQLIALAALDRSEHPKQYMDSNGIVQALIDMGFPDIAEELPDFSTLTEDMQIC